MSGPNPQQLQRHKDTVKDTLQGLVDTVGQIPGLIHDNSSKEVGAVITATALREGVYSKTQEGLDALPAELSTFDQVLDDVLSRSHDITQSLLTLRSFNTRPAAAASAQRTSTQQQQQQKVPQQQQQQQQQRRA